MQAGKLLKRNIENLLKARGQTRRDLAQWCRRSEPWLSKILSESPENNQRREIPLKYLDRIADFFGLAPFQLFQPGLTGFMERRKGERRSGKDRRVSAVSNLVRESVSSIVATLTPLDVADLIELRTLSPESRSEVRHRVATLQRSERPNDGRTPTRRVSGTRGDAATGRAARGGRRNLPPTDGAET